MLLYISSISGFTVYLYKKNSFDSVRLCFSCDNNKDARSKEASLAYFTFFITEKVRMLFRQEKSYAKSTQRRRINGTPVSKLVFKISSKLMKTK